MTKLYFSNYLYLVPAGIRPTHIMFTTFLSQYHCIGIQPVSESWVNKRFKGISNLVSPEYLSLLLP